MSSLTLWNPLREMDDLLNRFQRSHARPPSAAGSAAVADWAPSVDVAETDKEYTITADLAGVKKDDLKVEAHDGVLTVSGERHFEKEEKDKKHHRIERSYGSFSRSFALPTDVSEDQIAAEFKDGVVTVHLPKAELKQAKVTRIAVN